MLASWAETPAAQDTTIPLHPAAVERCSRNGPLSNWLSRPLLLLTKVPRAAGPSVRGSSPGSPPERRG